MAIYFDIVKWLRSNVLGASMAEKEEAFVVSGTVTQALANTRFRVQLDTGTEVLAHVAGKMRKNFIRIVPGDKVNVELLAVRLDAKAALFIASGRPLVARCAAAGAA